MRRGDWNYLRVRGEYCDSVAKLGFGLELPPRARRILSKPAISSHAIGTTSACAENTKRQQRSGVRLWNYLRVRGEYAVLKIGAPYGKELPPRARRIHGVAATTIEGVGTTSACAENTHASMRRPMAMGNYLRVRGEYTGLTVGETYESELPPRARRIR